jgi:RNA polymerase sigma-70 factor (ECF subfamily)
VDLFPSSTRTADTAELIARFRNHNPRAAGEVYERYGKLVFRLILNIVGDRRDAEDLLAEVLLMASNNLHAFETNELDVSQWLLILARNHSLRFRGDAGRTKEQIQFCKVLESVPVHRSSPLSLPECSPDDNACKIFRGLPEVDRLILELAWFEGLDSEQIASRMGITGPEVVALATSSLARIRKS